MMISIYDFVSVYGALICALVLFRFYCRSTFDHWRKLNVKFVEPITYFGNTAKVMLQLDSFQGAYDRLYKKLGDEPFGGIFQLRDPVLLVKDPQLVSAILVRDFKHFYDRGFPFMNENRELNPLVMHLFSMRGDRWRLVRQKMSPVFTSGKLKSMHEQMFDCVRMLDRYVEARLDDGRTLAVDLKQLFERLTIDVIGTCAFGIECNSMKSDDKFREMSRKVIKPRLQNGIRFMLSAFSKRILDVLKIADLPADAANFFKNLTLDTIEYRRRNGVTRTDVLQQLMELQNAHVDPKYAVPNRDRKVLTNEQFDEIDIAANSFLFFIAGFETTASTLSFCLYELALNQGIQQRLRDEVQQIKDKYNSLNHECLKDMTYMDAVITETLRKYPPVVALNRECTEDYVIPETKIRLPTGTKVLIPVWSIQHDWKNYPNPEFFDPERFYGNDKHGKYDGTFLPFGGGPRYCLGKRFADVEIKLALSVFILNYDFTPCTKTVIPLTYRSASFILQTNCGIWVKITKR